MRFVGIWNRALSAIEIAGVYQSLKTQFAGLGVTLPVAPPTLNPIASLTGVTATSVTVTLAGTNLNGATLSQMAGITATGVSFTDTSITATLLIAWNAVAGARSISVTTAGGTSNVLTFLTIGLPVPALTTVLPVGLLEGYWLAGVSPGSTAVPNLVAGGPPLTLFNNPTIGATGITLNPANHQYGSIAGVLLPATMTVITVSDTPDNSTFVEHGPNTNASDGFWFYGKGLSSFSIRRGTVQQYGPSDLNWEGSVATPVPVMLGVTFDGTQGVTDRNGAAPHSPTFAIGGFRGS
jgi:hypothetical protein